jgi:hypothetical protein
MKAEIKEAYGNRSDACTRFAPRLSFDTHHVIFVSSNLINLERMLQLLQLAA